MKDFNGRIAVVTGGGTGMGRELTIQLARSGCHVAICDVIEDNMTETLRLAKAAAPADTRLTAHLCDVASEQDMQRFRDQVAAAHGPTINLLFNNAGIGATESFVDGDRDNWERVFNICWYGVYYSCRTFMPMLLAADAGHIVNTSSVNGFWASLGPTVPHTPYSAAKFAVKGFTEALITDLRLNAPHIGVSLVMPGHIGTSIAINSGKVLGAADPLQMPEEEIRAFRERMMKVAGEEAEAIMNLSDDQIRQMLHDRGIQFRDNAPTSAADAATVILDGVRANRWRILVGDDAHVLDERVRAAPERAYDPDFEGLVIDV